MLNFGCSFAPPSMRNLWSYFSAISMLFPQSLFDFQSISIDFLTSWINFHQCQSASVISNQFNQFDSFLKTQAFIDNRKVGETIDSMTPETSMMKKMAKALFSAYLLSNIFALSWGISEFSAQRARPILVVLFTFLFPLFCLKVAKNCCFCLSEREKGRQKTRPHFDSVNLWCVVFFLSWRPSERQAWCLGWTYKLSGGQKLSIKPSLLL